MKKKILAIDSESGEWYAVPMNNIIEETKGLVKELRISAMREGFAIARDNVYAFQDHQLRAPSVEWEDAEEELEKKIKALQEKE